MALPTYQPSMMMRHCWQVSWQVFWKVLALVIVFLATPSVAEPIYDIDLYAMMSGKCSTLRIAGHDFACKTVAFFHSQQGRADFTIVVEDPNDNSHIISFSGENARREQENLYELSIDRMLLKSKDRPKLDGLPVPFVESSAGVCRQLGNLATGHITSISCTATDRNGKQYELHFESDGSAITVRRFNQSPLPTAARRAKQMAQLECRLKSEVAKVLPRDRTAYIIRCLEDDSRKPTTAEPQ